MAKGTLDLSWALSSTRVQVSDSPVTLAAVTGSNASTADITYSVVTQGGTSCAFGSNAQDATSFHTLTFNATGTCQVKAEATQTHYNNWGPITHNITVSNNTPVGITWSGYPNSNRVGMGGGNVEPNTPTFNPSSGTTGRYSHTGTGCEVDSDGTLTPLIADDSCVVTLTATTTDSSYDTGTTQLTVNVIKSDQSAPGASDVYGSSPSLVTGGTLGVVAHPSGHGGVTYQTTTADKCEVTPGGDITALLNGPCTIQAKWGGDTSYNPSAWGTVQTIQIGLGTLSITDTGSYTGSLLVGNAAGLTPSTPTTNPTGANFVYDLKQGETDCTLDATTGASHGKVIAANVAVTSGTTACTVVLTARKSGYNPATAELQVDLQGAALVFETVAPPAYPYPGFETDGSIEVGDLPSSDDNGISVTWSFVAVGSQSDGSAKNNVCTVDNSSSSATFGDVTADTAASAGDVCTVTITANTATLGYESWSQDIELEMGFLPVVEITGGYNYYCARFANGKAKCWGSATGGRLGNGDTTNHIGDAANEMGSSLAFIDFGTNTVKRLASRSEQFNCAILNDGTLKCWGASSRSYVHGYLGVGYATSLVDSFDPSVPHTIDLGSNQVAVEVVAGQYQICARVISNTQTDESLANIKCWGRNDAGNLGYGDTISRDTPPAETINLGLNKTAKQVAVGSSFACAILNDDTVKCWGAGGNGRLGHGDNNNRNAPESTDTVDFGSDDEGQALTAKYISLGEYHACAILSDDSLKCWGYNSDTLGNGSSGGDQSTPQSVNTGQGVKFVLANSYRTYVILMDGTVRSWGNNSKGALGYENTTWLNAPISTAVNLGTGRTARMLAGPNSSRKYHVCALLDDYTVKCWGEDYEGALGNGAGSDNIGDDSGEMGDSLPVVDLF